MNRVILMGKRLEETVILIPSLEPNEGLLIYVEKLQKLGFKNIVIVNDGSSDKYQSIFSKLRESGSLVLQHTKNKGKGAALKTGFHYIEQHLKKVSYIITVDSDGQHAAKDVYQIAINAKKHSGVLVLGTRDFSKEEIPIKSLFGNRLSSAIFTMLYGIKISDTQTGLRAFDAELLSFMQDIHGRRFEYELQMLISCIQSNIPIRTFPIQVIYENNNKGTHFKAIKDSIRVMKVLFSSFFRFTSTSIISAIVDLGIAWFLLDLLRPVLIGQNFFRIIISTVTARTVSIIINYYLNRNFVFHANNNWKSLWRYLSLSIFIVLSSGTGVYFIHTVTPISDKVAKLICDALLFILSYYLQQKWVFKERRLDTSGE